MLVGAAACDVFTSPTHPLPPPPAQTPAGGEPTTPPAATALPTPEGTQIAPVALAIQPVQSFRFTLVITDTSAAGVEITRMTGEWTPTALHLVTTLTASGGEQKTDSYLIGNTVYLQDNKGQWLQGPSGDPASILLMNPTLVLQQAQELGGLTLTPLGVVTWEGIACTRYQVAPVGAGDEAGSLFMQGIATVGQHNGWVYRFEFDRSEVSLRSQGHMVCTDFNTPIIIKPPI